MAAQANKVKALSEWEDSWQHGRIGFHRPYVHKLLKNNIDKLLCGRNKVRFFFPLCGKAVDMKWLADKGHSVVGVEISEKAIKQFFEEQNLTYSEELIPAIPEAKVFKVHRVLMERSLCISVTCTNFPGVCIALDSISLCGAQRSASGGAWRNYKDLARVSDVAGQFGGIWDRGSLVAINPCDRERYVALILSLMDKDCRYLVDTVLYNPELHTGPPFVVSDEDVKNLFGKTCSIAFLQAVDALEESEKEWGLDYLTEKVYLLTLKAN